MSEVAVERGEVGLERLRVALPERSGKGWGRDSAFAELLQNRVGDAFQTDQPAIAADRTAEPSTSTETPSRADDAHEDSRRDEEEEQNDVKQKDTTQATTEDIAVDVASNVGEERLPEQGDESVSRASESETLGEGERRRSNQADDSQMVSRLAVKNTTQPDLRSEKAPAPEPSSARRGAADSMSERDGEESPGETASLKAEDATGVTTIVPFQPSENAAQLMMSRDGKILKEKEAKSEQSNRNSRGVAEDRRKTPTTEIPTAGKPLQAGTGGETDGNLVSKLAAKEAETDARDEASAVDGTRTKGKRYGQKGEVDAGQGIQRFQPTRGRQEVPQAVTEGAAALKNSTPASGENVGSPAGSTAASGTAAAVSEPSAAASTPTAVTGTANMRTDSGGTADAAQATDSGRAADGSPSNLDAAGRARFVQRVAQAFRAANERGGHVRLRLHPPELGSLRVELKITDGVMSARMEAESAAARDLLAEHLPVLRQRLADHGIRVERFELDLMGQNGQGPSQQAFQPPADGQGRRHHDMNPSRRRTRAAESPGRPEGNTVGVRTASGIDVMI
ncbi:MAG: flagellar hook-length control protein FliK [Thermogutta sp.]